MPGFTKTLKLLICLLFSAIATRLTAQQPVLKIAGKDSARVKLKIFKVEVKLVGTTAITTIEMEFCNTAARVLEGELTFPMPDGVSISRYALDINGKMREAVPVEKEKGQVVFENIERRNVDPGLLEKTEGNNFRTRIYPIPANGCRKIIIGYEQQLSMTGSNVVLYDLPLHFKEPIAQFDISFKVFSKAPPEVAASCGTGMTFSQSNEVYNTAVSKRNFKPDGNFTIQVPKWPDAADAMVQQHGGQYYFMVNTFPEAKMEEKIIPDNIGIVWDVSLSGLNRDHAKEFELLDSYFKKKQNASISLTLIGYDVVAGGNYSLSGGNWTELKNKLEKLTYDGATNFGALAKWPQAGEYLFFSDGLSTYGNIVNMVLPGVPVHTINASPNANYPVLKYMAAKTGGTFINLNELPIGSAEKLLLEQQLLFLGIKENTAISELYPSFATPVAGGCTITGISNIASATITLLFGYGGKVLLEKTIDLSTATPTQNFIDIEKIWAQKKIASLELQYETNKNAITALGKKYGLVTQNTSLIVLDAVEDYVQYEIEPPAELKAAYASLVKAKLIKQARQDKKSINEAVNYYGKLVDWWSRDFAVRKIISKGKKRKTSNEDDRVYMMVEQQGVAADATPPPPPRVNNVNFTPPRIVPDEEVRGAPIGTMSVAAAQQYVSSDTARFNLTTGRTGLRAGIQPAVAETINATSGSTVYGWSASDGITGSDKNKRPPVEIKEVLLSASGRPRTLPDSSVEAGVAVYDSLVDFGIREVFVDRPYLKQLDSTSDVNLYEKYITLRAEWLCDPVYYFDVAKRFFANGDTATGLKILSNIADLNFDDHELYKMLGYQLKALRQYNEAVNVFRKVLQWRPQEPQSYRDYGLALADAGRYQQALDTLYFSLTKNFDEEISSLYPGIEEIIVTEINNLIARHGSSLNTAKIDKRILRNLPGDIRVVLNWNMNDTDIDLWVFDPNEEKCFYSHTLTAIGGRISADFTRGYGPEQFMLKKALKGKYKVMLNYYGDSQQKIAGPTTVMAEIFTNYGKPNQQSKTIALQMQKGNNGEVLVGEFDF
jgi:tetratricopeptide (TPR) repeat protein